MKHALNDLWQRRTLGGTTAGEAWRQKPQFRKIALHCAPKSTRSPLDSIESTATTETSRIVRGVSPSNTHSRHEVTYAATKGDGAR